MASTSKSINKFYNVVDSPSEATGVSKSTVKRFIAEDKGSLLSGELKFSAPAGKNVGDKKVVDKLTKGVFKRKIHEFSRMKKTVPILKKFHQDNYIVPYSLEHLRRFVRGIGFQWQSVSQQEPAIVARRDKFLKEIQT